MAADKVCVGVMVAGIFLVSAAVGHSRTFNCILNSNSFLAIVIDHNY